MRMKAWYQVTLSSLLALSCATNAWAHAAIFSDMPYQQAKQQAEKDKKFLLVDFTASWCPPCRKMESDTWTNGDVEAWVKANAIAVQVDVDKDRKTSAALNIEAMPTIILFSPQSSSKEFGRQVGYMSPSELLQWLEGAKSGKTPEQIEKEQSQSGGGSGGGESGGGSAGGGRGGESGGGSVSDGAWDHIRNARDLLTAGKHPEALEEYIWLWTNLGKADANLAEIRLSAEAHEMKTLSAKYPAAKAKFTEFRDAAEKADKREDWIVLNGILDDNQRTSAWFDKIKTDPKQRETLNKYAKYLEVVLYSQGKWSDIANYLYPDPMAKLAEIYKAAEKLKHPGPDTEVAKDFDPFPSMVYMLYGAYVGAGRDADAKKIADECLRLNDTAAMRQSLESMGTAMKQARAAKSKEAHK